MTPVRVKVCCIKDRAEARLAIVAGASAIGLVSAMPTGPGVIEEGQIAHIAASVPPSVGSFLLTSRQDVEQIVVQQRRCRTNTVQIVDRLETGTHADLRQVLPGVSLVQVVHVTGPESIDEADAIASEVDALLLDSGNPEAAAKELGGTGRQHDWALSREIVKRSPVPVFLAGGLNPDNVVAAIEQVRPFGVDVCSGVRSEDRLDAGLLRSFMAAVVAAGR